MIKSKKKYNFTEKEQSKDGKLATILGVMEIILLLFLIVRSIITKGNVGSTYGLAGMIGLIVSLYALFVSVAGFREEDAEKTFCIWGTLLNGISVIAFVSLFITGI